MEITVEFIEHVLNGGHRNEANDSDIHHLIMYINTIRPVVSKDISRKEIEDIKYMSLDRGETHVRGETASKEDKWTVWGLRGRIEVFKQTNRVATIVEDSEEDEIGFSKVAVLKANEYYSEEWSHVRASGSSNTILLFSPKMVDRLWSNRFRGGVRNCIAYLNHLPCFASLTPSAKERMLDYSSILQIPSNHIAFHAGEPIHSIYIIISGSIDVVKHMMHKDKNRAIKMGEATDKIPMRKEVNGQTVQIDV